MAPQRQYVCQACQIVSAGPRAWCRKTWSPLLRPPLATTARASSSQALNHTQQQKQKQKQKEKQKETQKGPSYQPVTGPPPPFPQERNAGGTASEMDREWDRVQQRGAEILSANAPPPSANRVEEVLRHCEALATKLVTGQNNPLVDSAAGPSLFSALLGLEEDSAKQASRESQQSFLPRRKLISAVSDLAHQLMIHPPVFITPEILARYISIQRILSLPQSFADVFALYATKPIPNPDTNPVTYHTPNPNKVQFAVPKPLADAALAAAIKIKDLPLAVDIIQTTYATPAFRRAKFIRKALFPLTGLALSPVAAYALAVQLAARVDTMDPKVATYGAFAGILAYIGVTSSIGLIAITTSNDQMDRVTWAVGTPLRERWLREEERAALDLVACAWGFKERHKRGDEDGEEWEALREWIARRKMVLDRPELMEGMQ